MACDTAFRVVARRYLGDLTANHQATCRGDPEALHQMRIALTRLRTAISFFSPMVADTERTRIRDELKWLQTQLGAVRDLDVAIERLKEVNNQAHLTPNYRAWKGRRADSHRLLAGALRSIRYRRLVKSISGWIEDGPWSIKEGRQPRQRRTSPIAAYSVRKLARWQETLLKKSRKLQIMSAKKRHRLRLLNKKLCYSIEFFSGLFSDKQSSRQQVALKYLRKAQKSLGQLNDDARSEMLAAAAGRDGVRLSVPHLGRGHQKRLIRTARAAYRKLAALKSVEIPDPRLG
jgi:CHAD domain-containing protein